MSKKHKDTIQVQFAKTVEAFSKYAVRDTPEILAEKVEFARPLPTDFALDVACGPGELPLALAPRVRFARGIDLTFEMLLQARQFQLQRNIQNAQFELRDRIEKIRDPSHAETLRLTTFLALFEKFSLEIARQALKRRPRSFNQWMLRAGLEPSHKHYREARKLLEDSFPGDRAGFSPQLENDDIRIVHNEGMFLLVKKSE